MKLRFTDKILLILAAVVGACHLGCVSPDRRAHEAAVLETLRSQLYSEDPAVAEQAAFALLSARSERSFRTLKEALQSGESSGARAAVILAFTFQKDDRIRLEAADALGDLDARTVELAKKYLLEVIGESAAGELLSRARDDSRPSLERAAAIEVMGGYGSEALVEPLVDLLEDLDRNVGEAGLAALREITYQHHFGAEPELWRRWYRQNRALGREEWRKVGALYDAKIESLNKEIEQGRAERKSVEAEVVSLARKMVDLGVVLNRPQIIMDVLANARPIEAQIYAVEKLGSLNAKDGAAVPLLIEKVRSSDARLVERCITTLGNIGDAKATDAVASRLGDGDPGVKLAAVKAYGLLSASGLDLLLPLAGDPSPKVRAAVAAALGERKWQGGFSILLGLLEDGYAEVRGAAAQALGSLGNQEAVPELIKLVEDADSKVVFEAVRSLFNMPDARSYDALIKATGHPDSQVREVAVLALGKLGDKNAAIRLLELSSADPDPRVVDKAWQALVSLIAGDPNLILVLSPRLIENGKLPRAEQLLKPLAEKKEGEGVLEARRMLARAYLARKNYLAAHGYFMRVLEAAPEDAEALAGVREALQGRQDFKRLAAVDAQQIAAGRGSGEVRDEFLTLLRRLMDAAENDSVVRFADEVLGAGVRLDDDFAAALREIRGNAWPRHLASLVGQLGAEDEALRATARAALSTYGAKAARALIEGLSSAGEPVRAPCLELLGAIAEGETFGFDPGLDPSRQQEPLAKWRDWLAAREAAAQ